MNANEKTVSPSKNGVTATVLPFVNTLSPYLQAVLNAKAVYKPNGENTHTAALERLFKSRQKK